MVNHPYCKSVCGVLSSIECSDDMTLRLGCSTIYQQPLHWEQMLRSDWPVPIHKFLGGGQPVGVSTHVLGPGIVSCNQQGACLVTESQLPAASLLWQVKCNQGPVVK